MTYPPSTISPPAFERAAGVRTWVRVALLGLAFALTSSIAADEDAEAPAKAEAKPAADAEAGADDGDRNRRRRGDAEGTLALAGGAEDPGSQEVCRNVRVTGTRIPQRVCMTAAQWESLRTQGQRATRDIQAQSGVMPPPRPGDEDERADRNPFPGPVPR